ncbi:hypothetical protein [Emergencia timonensis]|uniref:hypothetical protein n=1 Tax=Emergencia timonensis TaxID=1776384 RepID=UPI001A9A4D87|nr:hypothetical protein [Emergencia timonensis]
MITKDDRKRGASFVEGNRNDLRSAQGFTGWYDRVETRNVNYENRAAEGNSEYENRAAEGDVDYENRASRGDRLTEKRDVRHQNRAAR